MKALDNELKIAQSRRYLIAALLTVSAHKPHTNTQLNALIAEKSSLEPGISDTDLQRVDIQSTVVSPIAYDVVTWDQIQSDKVEWVQECNDDSHTGQSSLLLLILIMAVITATAYRNDSNHQATKEAGRMSIADALCIINEPTKFAYDEYTYDEDAYDLYYDYELYEYELYDMNAAELDALCDTLDEHGDYYDNYLNEEDDLIKCEHAMDTTQSIEMNNLIVILMGCKFEELSYHLRATLMPHYMRILRDTVHVYGPSLKPDDELYFGVNCEALFGDCKHYFACDVLSDFIYEKERLFMASSPVLIPRINIINIEHTQCGKDHWYGIHAIHTIQQMVEDKPLKRRMNDKMKQCIFEWLKPEDGSERVHKLLQKADKIQNEEERVLKRAHEDDDGKEQDPELDPDDSISCEYVNFDCIAQRIYVRQEETFEGTELIYQLECDEDIQGDMRPVVHRGYLDTEYSDLELKSKLLFE